MTETTPMNILVTGGRGYVGSCVTQTLQAQGHRVTVLSREQHEGAVVADLRNREEVRKAVASVNPDAIVHLAALAHGRDSLQQPLEYFDVNIGGTASLLFAARELERPPRIVFASTNVVYGSRYDGAMAEDLDCYPESPYAVSKFAAERLLQALAATAAISAVTLRIFNVAGAFAGRGDVDTTRIIPNAFRALTGELSHVTLNGDGTALRDFVHVQDVADAIVIALGVELDDQTHYDCFNVGSGVGTSMATILKTVERVTGQKVPVERAPQKPEPQRLTADITRMTTATTWKPTHSDIEAIIRDAWEAWQTWPTQG